LIVTDNDRSRRIPAAGPNYPAGDRRVGDIAVKDGWAMGRDALTNVIREFWPDMATQVPHRHP